MAEKIKIGGELDPRTPEKILGDASTIKDRTWETNHGDVVQTPNQKQDEINEYFQNQIDNIVATEQGGIQTDAAPAEGSVKLVQSGGTYTAIQNAVTTAKTFLTGETVPTIGIDANPTNNSTNLVKSGGVKTAIDNVAFSTNEKVKNVGIDDEPTAGSDNLVKSKGIKGEFNAIKDILSKEVELREVQTTYAQGPIMEDGTVGSSTYAKHSDFVEIEDGLSYKLHTKSTMPWCVAFYSQANENSFISSESLGNHELPEDIQINVPLTAKYLRTSLSTSSGSKFYESGYSRINYCVGDKIDDIEKSLSQDNASIQNLYHKSSITDTNVNEIRNILGEPFTNREVQTTYSSGAITSDGTVSSTMYAIYSDFVEIVNSFSYSLYTRSTSAWHVAFYSAASEDSFISATSLGNHDIITTINILIPENAVYMRITLSNGDGKFYYSGTELMTDNVPEKLDDIEEQVNDLEEPLTTIESGSVETTYSNGQINSDGTVGTSAYAKHSDFVQIQSNTSYSVYTTSTIAWCVAFYSSNSEESFISATSLGNHETLTIISITIPDGAIYMRTSLNTHPDATFNYQTQVIYSQSIPAKLASLQNQIDLLLPEEKYYVRPVGSTELPAADYNSITDALVDLKDDDSPKIIYIEAGTYDGFVEMGGQAYIDSIPTDPYPTSSDWRTYTKAIIPPNTQLIGLGMVTINFSLPANTDSHIIAILSPLAIKGGNVTIENITINGERCRYCIHDENGPYVHESTKIYRNVRLYMNTAGWEQSYGAGHGKNGNLLFENCIFSSYGLPWSVHDNSQTDNTTIIINSCVFLSSNSSQNSLRFGTTDANNGVKRVMINNCTFGTNKILLDTSNGKDNHYELTILHSGNPTVTAPEDNDYPPIIYQ